MYMKKILISILGLMLLFPLVASATPPFPMNFYGNVTINGVNAPIGSVIKVYDPLENLLAQFTLTQAGVYGDSDRTQPESAKLSVSTYVGSALLFNINSPQYDSNVQLSDTELYSAAFSEFLNVSKNLAFTGATPTAVASIAITPSAPSKVAGATQQFTATGTYTDNTTTNLTASCTWSSATAGVATIGSATGLATGVSYGTSVITATYDDPTNGALTDTETLTISASIPSGLAVSQSSKSTMSVSWTAVTGATSYKVYRDSVNVASPTTNSYSDTGLTSSTAYSYTVSAVNADGETSQCSAVSDTTFIDVPTGLVASVISSSQVNLAWTAVTGATSYKVYRDSVNVASPTSNSSSDTGLSASTAYSYTVSAVNADGETSQCSAVSGTTQAAATTSGGGGGGGVSMSITTNGEVTATRSAGGKTTVTDGDGNKASAKVRSNSVSGSTKIKVNPLAKTETAASGMVAGIAFGQSLIGNYIYSYTATKGTENLINFDNDVILTMTYKDDQLGGVNETDLKISYWNESSNSWIALSSTVNTTTNTVTAYTSHFTYFALLAGEGVAAEETTGIIDGDVVRAPDAPGMEQFDVYIIKLINGKKFRRLVLSPHVFESYGHLEWGNIKTITNAQMLTYEISNIIRCYDPTEGVDDPKVYRLYPDGDTGIKRWMNMSAAAFGTSYDWDSIYFINKVDRDAYTIGTDLTS